MVRWDATGTMQPGPFLLPCAFVLGARAGDRAWGTTAGVWVNFSPAPLPAPWGKLLRTGALGGKRQSADAADAPPPDSSLDLLFLLGVGGAYFAIDSSHPFPTRRAQLLETSLGSNASQKKRFL